MTYSAYSFDRGDHLVSNRFGYTHHGLYLGNGWVIHYSGFSDGFSSGDVCTTTLDDFSQGNSIWVKDHPNAKHGIEKRIRRALEREGEDEYCVVFNNCEHFVNWCIEGQHRSEQIESAALTAIGAYHHYQSGASVSEVAGRALASGLTGAAAGTAIGASGVVIGGAATTLGVIGAAAAAPALVPLAIGGAVLGAVFSLFDD